MTIVRAITPVTRRINCHCTEAALDGLGNKIRLANVGICNRQRTCDREITGRVNPILGYHAGIDAANDRRVVHIGHCNGEDLVAA